MCICTNEKTQGYWYLKQTKKSQGQIKQSETDHLCFQVNLSFKSVATLLLLRSLMLIQWTQRNWSFMKNNRVFKTRAETDHAGLHHRSTEPLSDIKRRKHSKPRFSAIISKDQERTLLIFCLGKERHSSNSCANHNTDLRLASVLHLKEGPQQAVLKSLESRCIYDRRWTILLFLLFPTREGPLNTCSYATLQVNSLT